MEWTDRAIILSVHRHSEHSAIVRSLSESHGLYAGVARGAFSSKQRGIYQPGNIVQLRWKARLPEHMGSITAELQTAVAALLLHDAPRLGALSAACTLAASCLAERHPEPALYAAMLHLIEALLSDMQWRQSYIHFELMLLIASGFGLDLTRCAVTGTQEDLRYVSPKSGRAVSEAAAGPYREKLLPLPAFLCHPEQATDSAQLREAFRLTGYFLDKWLFTPHGKTIPAARLRLEQVF